MDGYVGIGAWVRAGVGVAVGEADSSGGDAVGDGVGKLDGSVEVLGELLRASAAAPHAVRTMPHAIAAKSRSIIKSQPPGTRDVLEADDLVALHHELRPASKHGVGIVRRFDDGW